MEMKLKDIYANPDQPRKHFDRSKLQELADSIKAQGLLEPIVVAKRKDGYMIVAGERRYRASTLAGLKKVPVRVIEADDRKIAELALLENLQREDLNLIEEAMGYKQLIALGMTLEEVAQKMGFKQTWRVQERLNLLKLDTVYQDCLIKNLITPSQAQELSRLPSDGQSYLFRKIKEGKAESYVKLRSMANAILYKCENQEQEQAAFFEPASEEELDIKSTYDRMIERLYATVSGSFSDKDLKVLRSVLNSNLSVNIERIDLIMDQLRKIRNAMVQAESTADVLTGKEAA
jgi:ParB/RepB/Spo0J family partition protein